MVVRNRPGNKDAGLFMPHHFSAALAISGYCGNKHTLSYLLAPNKMLPPSLTAPHEAAARTPSWMEQETKANKKTRPLLPPLPLRTRAIKTATHRSPLLCEAPRSCAPEPRKSFNIHQADESALFMRTSALRSPQTHAHKLICVNRLQASRELEMSHLEVLHLFKGQAFCSTYSTWWGVEGGGLGFLAQNQKLCEEQAEVYLMTWCPCLLPTYPQYLHFLFCPKLPQNQRLQQP